MKEQFDIQVVLATPQDFEQWEEDAELAADKLNVILHALYEKADEDLSAEAISRLCQQVWEEWHEQSDLVAIDEEDLLDWVDHLLATWDDGRPS